MWGDCLLPLYGLGLWGDGLLPLYVLGLRGDCLLPLYGLGLWGDCPLPLYGLGLWGDGLLPLHSLGLRGDGLLPLYGLGLWGIACCRCGLNFLEEPILDAAVDPVLREPLVTSVEREVCLGSISSRGFIIEAGLIPPGSVLHSGCPGLAGKRVFPHA